MRLDGTLWELYLFYGIIFGIGLSGIGLSAIDIIALTTITRWFSQRRGFMTGIVKVGTGAGQFAIPLAASALILLYGWRWAIAAIGIGVSVILVLMTQFLRRDPDAGSSRPVKAASDVAAPQAEPGIPLSRVFRTVQLWTICMANLFLVFCLMIIMLHIVPYVRDSGVPPIQAAAVLSTIGGVSMLGRFVSGLVIDRRGSKTVMGVCFILLLGDLVWLQFAHRLWMLYLFAAFYGLAHGASSRPFLPLWPSGSAFVPTAPSWVSSFVSAPSAGLWAPCWPAICSTSAGVISSSSELSWLWRSLPGG